MLVVLTLTRAIDRRHAPITIGPVEAIGLTHRAITVGGERIVRLYDGAWRFRDREFLEARIEPVARDRNTKVRVWFERESGSPPVNADFVSLFGDRLNAGQGGDWIATDNDEAQCWVDESSARTSYAITVSGA